ncbi:MAG: hypothetical protein R3B82_05430 [Sandaracinaceae bacterium]
MAWGDEGGPPLIFVIRDERIWHITSTLPPAELEVTLTVGEADALAAPRRRVRGEPDAPPVTLVIADVGAMGGGEHRRRCSRRVEVEAPAEETAFVSATDAAVLLRAPTVVRAYRAPRVDVAWAPTPWPPRSWARCSRRRPAASPRR